MPSTKSIYFPGLNSVRCLAAFAVIFHHIEMFKFYENIPNLWQYQSVVSIGKQGVIMFFVLSGYLITYLLLEEKKQKNDISIKKFYARRILRIWPVYYLLLGISLAILANKFSLMDVSSWRWVSWEDISVKQLFFLVFFMPNIVFISPGNIPFFSQSWSIGVEEQFYLIWPVLLKVFKKTFLLLISVILIYLFIKIPLYSFIKYKLHYKSPALDFFKNFWGIFNIDSMAIGGIFSYLFYIKHKIIRFFYLKSTQLIAILLLVTGLITGYKISFINNEAYSLLFAIVILNISTNTKSVLKLENKVGNFLGKISYGLYMYHSFCIIFCIKVMKKFHAIGHGNFLDNALIYCFGIALTILVSTLSYNYFEKFFLKIKNKMALVKSSGESDIVTE